MPRALFDTLRTCLLTPGAFFAQVRLGADPFSAWLYALTVGSLGVAAAALWSMVAAMAHPWGTAEAVGFPPFTADRLLMTPVLITAHLAAVAALCHFILYVTGQRSAPLSMTFAAACYAESAAVFLVIPAVGGPASVIAFIILLIAALAGVHRARAARIAVSLSLPLLIPAVILASALAGGAAVGLLLEQLLKETLANLR